MSNDKVFARPEPKANPFSVKPSGKWLNKKEYLKLQLQKEEEELKQQKIDAEIKRQQDFEKWENKQRLIHPELYLPSGKLRPVLKRKLKTKKQKCEEETFRFFYDHPHLQDDLN